ncbi:hypothetical protein SpCBS45565_g03745 [Spizellomyces sp. 'palustris']|nr:hypothetical protein SpCBS45565_g03745 [Spizellomyces sp. 'palustris']
MPAKFYTTALVVLLRFLITCVAATHASIERRWYDIQYQGSASYYGDGYKTLQGGLDPPPIGPENGGWYGACYSTFPDRPPLVPKNFNMFAALNSQQFQSLSPKNVCGTCIAATNTLLGTRVVLQIVDSCPGCPLNGIDISHQAMSALLGGKQGSVDYSTSTWDPVHWAQAIAVGKLWSVQWQVTDCAELQEDKTYRVDGVPADQQILAQRAVSIRAGVTLFKKAGKLQRFS